MHILSLKPGVGQPPKESGFINRLLRELIGMVRFSRSFQWEELGSRCYFLFLSSSSSVISKSHQLYQSAPPIGLHFCPLPQLLPSPLQSTRTAHFQSHFLTPVSAKQVEPSFLNLSVRSSHLPVEPRKGSALGWSPNLGWDEVQTPRRSP